tara:strand:+ start:226 stop:1176 length:951 start_codon:yes stop_codon:yes gene_type:complete
MEVDKMALTQSNLEVRQARSLVSRYNSDPNQFTDAQAEKIALIAYRLGMPFRPEKKVLQKFFFELADTATFGLLDDKNRPVSRGETVYGETGTEQLASAAGGLLGLVVPGVAGAKVAGITGRALQKAGASAPKSLTQLTQGSTYELSKLGTAVAGAAGGATTGGLIDILEDPMGAPGRALTGAAIGGAFGFLRGANPTQVDPFSPRLPGSTSARQIGQTAGPSGTAGITTGPQVRVVSGNQTRMMNQQDAFNLASQGILREVARRPATIGDSYKGRVFEYVNPTAGAQPINLGTGLLQLTQGTRAAGLTRNPIQGL